MPRLPPRLLVTRANPPSRRSFDQCHKVRPIEALGPFNGSSESELGRVPSATVSELGRIPHVLMHGPDDPATRLVSGATKASLYATPHPVVGIFWDFENCPASADDSAEGRHTRNLVSFAQKYGTIKTFRAYMDTSLLGSAPSIALRCKLHYAGITLVECPHDNKKEVVDRAIGADLLEFAIHHPPHATIIIISGDRDYTVPISKLYLNGYTTIMLAPKQSLQNLRTAQTSSLLSWPDLKPLSTTSPALISGTVPLPRSIKSLPEESSPPNLPDATTKETASSQIQEVNKTDSGQIEALIKGEQSQVEAGAAKKEEAGEINPYHSKKEDIAIRETSSASQQGLAEPSPTIQHDVDYQIPVLQEVVVRATAPYPFRPLYDLMVKYLEEGHHKVKISTLASLGKSVYREAGVSRLIPYLDLAEQHELVESDTKNKSSNSSMLLHHRYLRHASSSVSQTAAPSSTIDVRPTVAVSQLRNAVPSHFLPLIDMLIHHCEDGSDKVTIATLAGLGKNVYKQAGAKKQYLDLAEKGQILVFEDSRRASNCFVSLHPRFAVWKEPPSSAGIVQDDPGVVKQDPRVTVPYPFIPLYDVMVQSTKEGSEDVSLSKLGALLSKEIYGRADVKNLRAYIDLACDAGIVEYIDLKKGSERWVALSHRSHVS